MRGSPLIRTFLLCLGLLLAWLGVHRLTSRESAVITPPATHSGSTSADSAATTIPFELTLSAPAREVIVESAGKVIQLPANSQILTGELTVTDDHPAIFVTVRWAESGEVPRFAKLRIEPPSLATRSHTFDALGDIEDVWEPHLH